MKTVPVTTDNTTDDEIPECTCTDSNLPARPDCPYCQPAGPTSAVVISVADVLADSVDEAEQAQAKADEVAARFAKAADEIAAVATFVRRHPHLAKHMRSARLDYGTRICVYVGGYGGGGAATVAEFATAAARAGYKVIKKPGGTDDQFFGVEIHFGWPHIYVYADRDQVCERVVTGTETVTKEVPDPDALAAVPTVTVTETVEQVEWRCGPLLGGAQ